jgi:hypothetical protein
MAESQPTPEMHPMSDLKDLIVTPEQLRKQQLEQQIREAAYVGLTQINDVNAIREGLPLNINLHAVQDDEKEKK